MIACYVLRSWSVCKLCVSAFVAVQRKNRNHSLQSNNSIEEDKPRDAHSAFDHSWILGFTVANYRYLPSNHETEKQMCTYIENRNIPQHG